MSSIWETSANDAPSKHRNMAKIRENGFVPFSKATEAAKKREYLATTLHEKGAVLDAKGNRDGALRYLHHSLKLQRELHGDDANDPGIATMLHDIGMVLNDTDDCDGALDYLQQSLRMRTSIYGAVHEDIAPTLHEIGRVLAHKNDHKGALEYLQRSLEGGGE